MPLDRRIPAPINKRPASMADVLLFAAEASKVIGQPALKASITWGELVDGVDRTATIQVRNTAGEACSGTFMVAYWMATASPGIADGNWSTSEMSGGRICSPIDGVLFPCITDATGRLVVRVTSYTAGQTGVMHAAVLAAVDAAETLF